VDICGNGTKHQTKKEIVTTEEMLEDQLHDLMITLQAMRNLMCQAKTSVHEIKQERKRLKQQSQLLTEPGERLTDLQIVTNAIHETGLSDRDKQIWIDAFNKGGM